MNEMLKEDNPVRDQPWSVQIDHFGLNCTSRTLERACKRRRPKAGRYKMAKIKLISFKNKQLRKEYGRRHQAETIDSFWQYIHFTDEAHFDPDESYSKRVLREGTRYEASKIQTMPDLKGVELHIAASISWHHQSPLQFYHDKHDDPLSVIIKKPPKPRRSKYQTEETYQQRIIEWEASLSHDPDIKSKGNSMTQAYYTEHLLPV